MNCHYCLSVLRPSVHLSVSLSKVHKALTDDSPMLVHCSDGIGRSGTFCLVDISIRRVARGKGDVFTCLMHSHTHHKVKRRPPPLSVEY